MKNFLIKGIEDVTDNHYPISPDDVNLDVIPITTISSKGTTTQNGVNGYKYNESIISIIKEGIDYLDSCKHDDANISLGFVEHNPLVILNCIWKVIGVGNAKYKYELRPMGVVLSKNPTNAPSVAIPIEKLDPWYVDIRTYSRCEKTHACVDYKSAEALVVAYNELQDVILCATNNPTHSRAVIRKEY